jgi:peptidoglycan/xylan/chitin deacetylase (PgdA/CDA1 family)
MTQSNPIEQHYRCAEQIAGFQLTGRLKDRKGFFRLGPDVVCYGQTTGDTSSVVNGDLFDASKHFEKNGRTIALPFDPAQVLENLRYERYVSSPKSQRWTEASPIKWLYYAIRPMLPVAVRKHLQKAYLTQRGDAFPSWPVDRSVDILLEKLLALTMQSSQIDRIPFIWFWPNRYEACAVMTHDVETKAGRDFCDELMNINDAFGIKASFQIVPEKRYTVSSAYLENIRKRGFEVNVHGLDHQGNLFESRDRIRRDAAKINEYAELFGARGFRSPALYRNADWFQELNFSYDLTVPNVARLEAQGGGCCTLLPYFLPGGMLELPLTITEDYTLFHILGEYSTTLWKEQVNAILRNHGLIHFLVHPDYIIPDVPRQVYKALLEELCGLRSGRHIWFALPGEIDHWWRERNQMSLTFDGRDWRVDGPGSDRATIAYACLNGDGLVYEMAPPSGVVGRSCNSGVSSSLSLH